jgi:IPT/TIG domain
MEHRARTRLLRRAGTLAALMALLVPASAGAATAHAAKKRSPAPVITSISPRALAIGETLTIRGHHFKRGRNKNTVAFKRTGGAAVFVKAAKSTTKMLKVTLPARLEKALFVRNGERVPTKLRLRVLSARFGKRFSTGKRVPRVAPPHPPVKTPPAADPDGDCDGDGQRNSVDTDDDNDLLPDTLEKTLKTDGCKFDSDGDGVSDGYEYQSSRDLNDDEYQNPQSILPAPWKKPYPNALFPDAGVDYDGDSLTLGEEFALWKAFRNPANGLHDLVYSDGNQFSAYGRDASGRRPGAPIAGNPVAKYQGFIAWAQAAHYWNVLIPVHASLVPAQLNDFDRNGSISATEANWWDLDLAGTAPSDRRYGKLSDDERDEDGDGLSNYDEFHGRMQPGYWGACYSSEVPYPVAYAGTSPTDFDTDGDGVLDGADDQDHDDIPNLMELSRKQATGRPFDDPKTKKDEGDPSQPNGRVNPFNPCLPDPNSRTCPSYIPFGSAWAPFDGLEYDPDGDDPDYLVLN